MEDQRAWEAFYQELVAWAQRGADTPGGAIQEFKTLLRTVELRELVALMRTARRLELLGDPDEVAKRLLMVTEMIEAHERWEQRRKDLGSVIRIFTAVGALVTASWVWGRDLISWLAK